MEKNLYKTIVGMLLETRGRPSIHPDEGEKSREADQHIVTQLRKAVDWKPQAGGAKYHVVKFIEGQHEVTPEHAEKFLEIHEKLKPEGKLHLYKLASKSHEHFLKAIGVEH